MKQEIIEAVKKDLLEHYRSRRVNARRKEIGLSLMTFKRVMNGSDMNLDVAECLCKALKLDHSFDYMPMLRKLIVTRTQSELADELGTSSAMVSYWLQGKMKPRLSMFLTIKKLAEC